MKPNKPYLMLHQKEGIKFLNSNDRALLADEAGLGKSRQVLEAAKNFIVSRSMLVLCPTSVVGNWQMEAEKWDFPLKKFHAVGYEYGFLHRYKEIARGRWGVIVADESQFLRNWGAQRTKLFAQLIKGRDSKIWFLSGTPMYKGAKDLHPTLSFIQPGKWGKYKDFCEKFCKQRPNQWLPGGIEYYDVKNGKILSAAMSNLMLRRFKKDHLPDLPAKLFSKIPMDIGLGNFDIFANGKIIKAVLNKVDKGGSFVLDTDVAETVRELGLKKVNYVVKFCEDILFPHPLVIFGHHRLVLYDIAEKLTKLGRKVQVIIGRMDRGARDAYIKQFQNGEIDDLVCSLGVAGVGLNLFRSSRCVFAEYPWTWAGLDQAADRLHRIGQHDSVNVYMPFAKGTFEERQLYRIEERKEMMKEVIGI